MKVNWYWKYIIRQLMRAYSLISSQPVMFTKLWNPVSQGHEKEPAIKEDETSSKSLRKTDEDWRRLKNTDEDWRRLAKTDEDWRRLTKTDEDWRRLTKTDEDWRRLAKTDEDWQRWRRLTKMKKTEAKAQNYFVICIFLSPTELAQEVWIPHWVILFLSGLSIWAF